MVCLHVGLMVLVNFADLTMGTLILHLFTFDPTWIPWHIESVDGVIQFDVLPDPLLEL
jgi:hypothetical protein